MKRFDDEDLIAHYLHELPPQKADALERAMQTDPALAARYESYATMLHAYKAGAATMVFDEEVMARNWKALQPALTATRVGPAMPSRWRWPVLAGAGLAFAATALFFATRPHNVASVPPTSPLHQAGDTTLSTPLSESSSTDGVANGAPGIEVRGAEQQRGRTGRPFAHLLTSTPRDLPGDLPQFLRPHMGAILQMNTAEAAIPHFIPLASMSLPALPVPKGYLDRSAPADSTDPANSSRTAAPRGRSKSGHWHTGIHHDHPTDLTFAMGGTLVGTSEGNGTGTVVHTDGATHAVSASAAFHQQLRPAVGYRLTVSYTRPDFQYSSRDATTSSGQIDINGRVYELAATYVVQGPHRGGLSTSVEAGGGLMAFLPTLQNADTSYNLRGAAVVGIAAEYALSKHVAIHAGYRAQVYKSPDFHYSGPFTSVAGTTFVSNEPMVGITYRFHSK